MRNLYTMAFAAAGLTLAASPAAAVTFTSTPGSTTSFAAPAGTVVDFNGSLPTGVTLTGSNFGYATGSSSNSAQPAFSDGSRYLAVYGTGTATLAADAAYQAISIFIGSIDSYNTVSLLSTTGAVLASYTGADLSANANGGQGSAVSNRRITFTASAGETFGAIVLGSGGNSLEVDNVVFSVPEPSTWALMFLGFGMIGATARYRRGRGGVVTA